MIEDYLEEKMDVKKFISMLNKFNNKIVLFVINNFRLEI